MKRFSTLSTAVMALLATSLAHSDVFKCVAANGAISFAYSPCPTYVGESTLQRPPPARLSSEWEETDFPYRLNKNATEILQVSRRRKLIITNEREIADRLQSIRPPPPGLPSTCTAPRYDSACFDPSGGRVRQPVKSGLMKSSGN
ncbi:DUF4124 domain-containing protein [Pseudomonas sp. KU26590]|uniref:DUF4124 domain-containing protein n=1 Tax=Pseudomonas sp. KU26590 TaxID=2991051 RepID=UPI00223D3B09|nr:DUF4124 domain-containing protein [Pseudomonas sp. KU26590]UZJ58902.1 DUF4124 domain-containing protein [Pseudomonas sp. KU26590]